MTGSTDGKKTGPAVSGQGKTPEAKAEKPKGEGAGEASPPGRADNADSPKRQGDKLEHATKAAAGKPQGS